MGYSFLVERLIKRVGTQGGLFFFRAAMCSPSALLRDLGDSPVCPSVDAASAVLLTPSLVSTASVSGQPAIFARPSFRDVLGVTETPALDLGAPAAIVDMEQEGSDSGDH